MYVGTTMFTMPPGKRPEMEQLADRMLPMMKQMSGYVSIMFVVDEETNEYGGIALWETKEDAETASSQTTPKMDEAVGGIAIGPIRRSIYEVYDSKA